MTILQAITLLINIKNMILTQYRNHTALSIVDHFPKSAGTNLNYRKNSSLHESDGNNKNSTKNVHDALVESKPKK